MATNSSLDAELTQIQNQEGKLDPKPVINGAYNPNKRRRAIRRQVYARWYWLKSEPARVEAEAQWEIADKEWNMYETPKEDDDWHSDLHLPDAFAAIRTQSQETIERKTRPSLSATEESDEPIKEFANAVINHNMNVTGFDYQIFLARLAASYRGTAFVMDYWRTEKRIVRLPDSVDEKTGEIKYITKEIVDFDDDYTEFVPNEFIYVDEKADHIDNAGDMFRREIINIDDFHLKYDKKPGFYDTQFVYAGGDTSDRSFFKLPGDITHQDIEVLHYFNRNTDAYWCVANNVAIYDGPLPTKHKELPLGVFYQYRVPGRFWGLGIPKIIHHLSEERRSIRNLNMDRQKIIVGGAFLHNNAFDIDDDDETIYPGKWISIDTQGQPINQAIQPLSMGEVPPSYFRTEEIILEDIRRAHGIDDRIQGVQAGGTATEAAILKESSLKGINLISLAAEMDTFKRIGRLKWLNIQFFYGAPRMERITENNEERLEKKYRTITVNGQKFSIENENGKKQLCLEDIKGASALKITSEFGKYLAFDYDIYVDSDVYAPISKAIEQTKKTEMFSLFLSNPATMQLMDMNGAATDVLSVNNIKPESWLKSVATEEDMRLLAETENMIMMAGTPLDGTENATEEHTLIHIHYTKTAEFQQAPQHIQTIIMDHILQEHDANPNTGSSADLLSSNGLAPGGPGAGQAPQGMPQGAPGQGNPLAVGAGQTTQPQAQVADIQPTNFSKPE